MSRFILRCPLCYVEGESVTEYSPEGYSYCNNCRGSFSRHDERHDLLHYLWTKATRQSDYEKKVWQRLQELIDFLK